MTRITHQDWRTQQRQAKYPFADYATLRYDDDRFIDKSIFLDATIYPIGGQERMRLSKIVVSGKTVELHVGMDGYASLCSGSFEIPEPGEVIKLSDDYGRPAGVFVVDPVGVQGLHSWGEGEYEFSDSQTALVASVCVPMPEFGVRGFILESGDIFTGDVWLVGENGVVLRTEADPAGQETIIRVDVVGDPLFKRALCDKEADSPLGPVALFKNKTFLKTINNLPPDEYGDFKITGGSNIALDSILRVYPVPGGVKFEFVGEKSTS